MATSAQKAQHIQSLASPLFTLEDMEQYEYIQMPVTLFPQHTIDLKNNNIDKHKQNGHIYLCMDYQPQEP
jgi:hypothetical protein